MGDEIKLDCFRAIQSHLMIDSDACAAAISTIRAAEIQARATYWSGFFTLVAGAFAIFAAIFAYHAARSETKRLDNVEREKKKAYAVNYIILMRRLSHTIDEQRRYMEIINDLSKCESIFDNILHSASFDGSVIAQCQSLLVFERWQDMSYLPVSVMETSALIAEDSRQNSNCLGEINAIVMKEINAYLNGDLSREEIARLNENRQKACKISARSIELCERVKERIRKVEDTISIEFDVSSLGL